MTTTWMIFQAKMQKNDCAYVCWTQRYMNIPPNNIIFKTISKGAEWNKKQIQAIKKDKELLKKANSIDAGNEYNINSKIKKTLIVMSH